MTSRTRPGVSAKYRVLGPFARLVMTVLTVASIILAIIYIFGILVFGKAMLGQAYLYGLLAMLMPLCFVIFPLHPWVSSSKIPWYDLLLSSLCFVIPAYYFVNGEDIMIKGWEFDAPGLAFGMALVLWGIILEACRRAVGLFFAIFLLLFSIYPLFGEYAPGFLGCGSFSLRRITCYHILSSQSALGLPLAVLGYLFIGFLVFAATLMATGASKAFLDFAMALFGRTRGAPGKISVISSALVASVTGGPLGNIMITGPITIPSMKKAGYASHVAAAIEACASTGGVLMPPVMGAVAFVMAGFLNISYTEVCVAAIVPSCLYYVGLLVQIDGHAVKGSIKRMPKSEIPSFLQAFKEIAIYIATIGVLFVMIAYLHRDAQAPFYALIFLLATCMVRKKTRLNFRDLVGMIQTTGRLLAELVPILAGVGFVLGSLMITGVAQSLTSVLLDIAKGNALVLVLLGGAVSFVLGMGLTVTAVYVMLAVLLAPALVGAGLNVLSVHMFIMYCGMLSYITPPVALGSYAAASLAGADGMKVGFYSVRLGLVIFILPFLFVLNPALVLQGPPLVVTYYVVAAFVGVLALSSAVEGYLIFAGILRKLQRLIVLTAAVILFILPWQYGILGAALLGGVIITKHLPIKGGLRTCEKN